MAAPVVLVCVEWDATSQTCTTQAWQEMPSVFPALPTAEQAHVLMLAVLPVVAGLAAMKAILKPRKE